MFDRRVFLRPIAHRGLHDADRGLIENTAPAFEAAIARGYGIECDLRPAAGGEPVVFHDETLDRLVHGSGPVAALEPRDLETLRYRGQGIGILTFFSLLELAAGRVPLLVEVKSEWDPPHQEFLSRIAALARAYDGPLALMSFDPAVMAALKDLAPGVPRGIVSGLYEDEHGETWWREKIDKARADRLSRLLESGPAEPSFYAYHVKALPQPVTEQARHVLGLPVFAWTVRTEEDRARAAAWADAPIFEGLAP